MEEKEIQDWKEEKTMGEEDSKRWSKEIMRFHQQTQPFQQPEFHQPFRFSPREKILRGHEGKLKIRWTENAKSEKYA
jgi:hypothetical protein